MADFRADHEIVTKFLIDTCQLLPVINWDSLWALCDCAPLATRRVLSDSDETNIIPVLTGSVTEFYVDPMLSCIGDFDIMFHRGDVLAIPAGTAPPTQLPGEFDCRVKVFEIVDSEFPGYVYLVSSYLLTECVDDGKYNAVECQREYLRYKTDDKSHGPARVIEWSATVSAVRRLAGSHYSRDLVPCCRCLSWPSQAADWPTRHRNYGWPDSATVDRVVSNGCDVVEAVRHLGIVLPPYETTHEGGLRSGG